MNANKRITKQFKKPFKAGPDAAANSRRPRHVFIRVHMRSFAALLFLLVLPFVWFVSFVVISVVTFRRRKILRPARRFERFVLRKKDAKAWSRDRSSNEQLRSDENGIGKHARVVFKNGTRIHFFRVLRFRTTSRLYLCGPRRM